MVAGEKILAESVYRFKKWKSFILCKSWINSFGSIIIKKMFHILPKRVMTEAPFLSDGLRH